MATIAEAYFHFRVPAVGTELLERHGNRITEDAVGCALEIGFPDEATISVYLRAGSIKGWIKISSPKMMMAITLLSSYAGLKESVNEIIKDGRRFSSFVADVAVREFKVNPSSVFRVERRSKTPGRILRVLKVHEQASKYRKLHPAGAPHAEREIARLMEQLRSELSPEDFSRLESLLGGKAPPPEYDPRVAILERRPTQQDLFGIPSHRPVIYDYKRSTRLSDWAAERPQ